MIRNPDFRADFDTNSARAAMNAEVRRGNSQVKTFNDMRNADAELRLLNDGQLTEIAQNIGLDVIG